MEYLEKGVLTNFLKIIEGINSTISLLHRGNTRYGFVSNLKTELSKTNVNTLGADAKLGESKMIICTFECEIKPLGQEKLGIRCMLSTNVTLKSLSCLHDIQFVVCFNQEIGKNLLHGGAVWFGTIVQIKCSAEIMLNVEDMVETRFSLVRFLLIASDRRISSGKD